MESMYACLILHSAGMPITEDSLEKVLVAAGVEPNIHKLQALVAALMDIDINEAISKPPTPVLVEPDVDVPVLKPEAEEIDDMGLGMLFGKPAKKEKEEEEMTGLSALFGK